MADVLLRRRRSLPRRSTTYYADITSITPGEDEPVVLAVIEFAIDPELDLQIQGVAVRSGAFAVTTAPATDGSGRAG